MTLRLLGYVVLGCVAIIVGAALALDDASAKSSIYRIAVAVAVLAALVWAVGALL